MDTTSCQKICHITHYFTFDGGDFHIGAYVKLLITNIIYYRVLFFCSGHISKNWVALELLHVHVGWNGNQFSWWRHQMETFSALLALCEGNSSATGEFPSQRPVTRSFDVFFDLRLDKRLSKQSWGWRFETPSRSLWRHCNVNWKYNGIMQWRDTEQLRRYPNKNR